MKILFWAEGFWPRIGGSETQVLRLLEEMCKRGHQCMVLAQKDHPDSQKEETYRGIAIRRFDFNAIMERRDVPIIHSIRTFLEELITEFQPDIVHLNACVGGSAFVFSLFKNMFCMPIVATVHAPYFKEGKFSSTMERIAASTDQICCVSKWTLQVMEECLPLLRNKMRLIYNGLAMPNITPSDLPFSPPTILLLGRLSSEKGFETAIEAFFLLKKEETNARLFIAGGGPESPYLEHLVNTWGLKSSVQFTGELTIDQVPSVINQATLMVVSSYYEPFGLVALEAMQMKRPVIASDVGGLREIISDGATGLLVPPQDPLALSKAIQSLLKDPERAINMGAEGHAQAMEKFTLSRNADEYEDLYKELLKTPKLIGSGL